MFIFMGNKTVKDVIRSAVTEAEGDFRTLKDLKKEIRNLKEETADAKLAKRIEEEELKALVKIKEEKLLIEAKKKELELQDKFNKQEMAMQKDYHDKVVSTINEQRKESKELYTAIMEKLPDVNVALGRGKLKEEG